MNQSADICMQCRNKDGMLGSFLKDGDEEISPCFAGVFDLCLWMAKNGWTVGWDYRAHKIENNT
jgi:hypothetical protein